MNSYPWPCHTLGYGEGHTNGLAFGGCRFVMPKLLPKIDSPEDLSELTLPQLEQLASEMREAICNVVSNRTAHFASNLGVVELCLALHSTFDFRYDRLMAFGWKILLPLALVNVFITAIWIVFRG